MWKLSIEDDQGEKTSVNLVRDEYTVGRAEANTIRLTERNISRHHARLFREANAWYVGDRESYNGAFVNGARVVDPVRIAHGDLIQLGDYRLEIVDEALAASRTHPTMRDGLITTTGRRDTLVNQPDRLVMVVGPAPGTEYPLSGTRMVVGRGEECDISINHASVSRVHAEVHAIGDGRYELIDKGSANGVRVNAVELQRALIDARDNIELGDVILKFVPKGDIYVPGADEAQKLAAGQTAAEAFSLSAEPSPRGPGLPFALKAAAGLLAIALLVLVGMLALGKNVAPTSPSPSTAADPAPPKTSTTLGRAKQLLDNGDVFGAHAKLLELPATSAEKNSEVFRVIEGRWADALMEAAEKETDVDAKRGLLDQVAKSPGVDQARRTRAASALAALDDADAMEIDELLEGSTTGAVAAPAASPAPPPKRVSPAQRLPVTSAERPAAAPKKPANPPAPAHDSPTLVRDDPFGSTKSE
ncbi:MAG TPA: FHA domain-containing protein [Polyangiaceae bacterium]